MTGDRHPQVVRMLAGTAYGRRRAEELTAELREVVLPPGLPSHAEAPATGAARRRRGRMDWFGQIADTPGALIIEIKDSDWDQMAPHRVRPNACRHARQLYRYLDSPEVAAVAEEFAQLFVEYRRRPRTPGRTELVEDVLNDRGITVVWAEEAGR